MPADAAHALVLVDPPAAVRGEPAAPGTVPRTRLVRGLAQSTAPIALVVAPAGFGKTTLIAEWAQRDPRPFTWLTCPDDGAADEVLDVLERAARSGCAQVIVVDDLRLTLPPVTQRLLSTACRLPSGSAVVLVSRMRLPGAFGRLRARRLLLELGMADLALSPLEAAMLVEGAGLRLDRHRLKRLLTRTGGWPVMVDLAAAAIDGADDADAAISAFTGADRAVAEFLRDEVLAPLTPDERSFLRRTSILTHVTSAACDAVLDAHGSGALLTRLVHSGVPLQPLDRTDLAFRFSPLLAQMLRSELAFTEPEHVGPLHRRAARHFAGEGEPEAAIRHAIASGDVRLAGRIAWTHAPRTAAGGRAEPLGAWLDAVHAAALPRDAGLALTAAVHHLLTGRRRAACAATDVAEHLLRSGPLPGGDAAVALLRACVAGDGIAAVPTDAARARALLPAESPWHALALTLEGVARHLGDDPARARTCLDEAAGRAAGHLPVVAALAHAQLALLEAEAEDWEEGDHHAREARAALPATAPDAVCALVAATSAVIAAHRGEIAQARHDAGEADRLLASRADFPAWLLCEAHVWLARAEIRLSDGPAARRLLARAARLAPAAGEENRLSRWIHDGWARADAFAESATGDGPTLTNAELRILRQLPSHMSFREIGLRLHVSTNTVKTQALSVYRKLDVSCRSDAVERGRQAGLIGDA